MLKLILFIATICLFACNNPPQEMPQGGACIFDTIVLPVTVKTISHDSSGVGLVMGNYDHDSIYHLVPTEAYNQNFIAKGDSIQVNDTLELLRIHPVRGSCTEQPSVIRSGTYLGELDGKY